MAMERELGEILDAARRGRVVVLTGAGISAESGIPTFRGPEGYWTVGSRVYAPQEIATWEMFARAPEEVWRWYLYRFGVCRSAQPNAAHLALAGLERTLGERFTLVTQNVDGLHHRAGNSRERTYCIHGDARAMRCADPTCLPKPRELPDLGAREKDAPLTRREQKALRCERCGGWMRPHVLWFDECYDEEHYRMDAALDAAWKADLLVVVGTSGATNLPMQIGGLCARRGVAVVDVNPEANPFSELAQSAARGFFARGKATERVPEIVERLAG